MNLPFKAPDPLLTAIPKAVFSTTWYLEEDGVRLAELYMAPLSLKTRSTLTLANEVYELAQPDILSRGFVMRDADGFVVAKAVPPFLLSSNYLVTFNDQQIHLKRAWFAWKEMYGIYVNDQNVGSIFQPKWFSRSMALQTSLDIPQEAKMFLLWIGIIARLRESSSS